MPSLPAKILGATPFGGPGFGVADDPMPMPMFTITPHRRGWSHAATVGGPQVATAPPPPPVLVARRPRAPRPARGRARATVRAVPPATATAVFVGTNTAANSNWRLRYGSLGYFLVGDASGTDPVPPVGVGISAVSGLEFTWSTTSLDPHALENVAATGTIAASYYSNGTEDLNVNLSDGNTYKLTMYCLDWDNVQGTGVPRSQRIDVLDQATSVVLDSRTITNFFGSYLSWNCQGHVVFRLTNLGDPTLNNCVYSAFFSDPPGSALVAPMAILAVRRLPLPVRRGAQGRGHAVVCVGSPLPPAGTSGGAVGGQFFGRGRPVFGSAGNQLARGR